MNTAPFTDRSAAAAANQRIMRADYSLEFDVLTIRIIPEGIGNSGRPLKCGNF
jgi:hypothetical protein